ncbi:hypothetical protein C2142_38435 [Streptomyces sp. CB01881]|nr:hypothetical protein C2142_38435 [Streptomyces sp. CB01881]
MKPDAGQDEAAGDRSYGDRAAGTGAAQERPDPAAQDPAVRERYDATADAAQTVRDADEASADGAASGGPEEPPDQP